jgi:general secretion pathway protein L
MSQTLLFRFISPERAEWLTDNMTVREGDLTELASEASGRRSVLVVPGEAVTLTEATVPARSRSTWLKALPYALEDSLAGDVEDMHFAVGDTPRGTQTAVAVVSHERMKSWVDTYTQAGISPVAVVPDILLIPYEEGSWSLLLEGNRGIVRCGPFTGFAIEREDLPLVLELAFTEAGDSAPQSLRIWGEQTADLSRLTVATRFQGSSSETLKILAVHDEGFHALNLLQGPYGRRAQLGKWLRPWHTAAALAGCWLALQVVAQIQTYWQLTQQEANLRVAMEQVYRDSVPSARKIVNPKVQLENRLRELQQSSVSSEATFLDLLYGGGEVLMNLPGITLRALRYKDDQLDLDLEGSSLEVLDQLKQRFTQQSNLIAEIRTTKREGKAESQVSLKRAPS